MTRGTWQQTGPGCRGFGPCAGSAVRRAAWRVGGGLLAVGAVACAPSGTDSSKLPPNIPDPSTVQTAAGALAFYSRVLTLLPPSFDSFVTETAIFTDELAALPSPVGTGGSWTALDSRSEITLPNPYGTPSYNQFHQLRAQAREARGFLGTYALPPDSTDAYDERDLRAHLYVLEGYAEIFLADLYCSGIPLSTVDFRGDYTLTPGFATKDVYLHAAGLFDSALALMQDSAARFQPLAAVGKGRALLGAGRFAEAAAAVTGVPDGYQYQVVDQGGTDPASDSRIIQRFAREYDTRDVDGSPSEVYRGTPGMGDREGETGLPYVSSADPRTPATELGPGPYGGTMYFPTNYPQSGPVPLTLANGVEARLIEAEAALQGGDVATWLAKLNALRQTVGLADTTDPGSDTARVSLLFRERGFWLYLSGHRQGDLRRLIRQYGRAPTLVYPSGFGGTGYPGGTGMYGTLLVAPVPDDERQLNPKYTGCIDLQA